MKCSEHADHTSEMHEQEALICKALASSVRLRLLDVLADGECLIADLHQALGISGANLSQHLSVLKGAGLVVVRRDGARVYAALALPELRLVRHTIKDLVRQQVRNARRPVCETCSGCAACEGHGECGCEDLAGIPVCHAENSIGETQGKMKEAVGA